MARKLEDSSILGPKRHPYGSFGQRYPDYPSWLDGNVWELTDEDLQHEPVNSFRASLYYQAHELGLKLRTKQIRRHEEDANGDQVPCFYLLVQAY